MKNRRKITLSILFMAILVAGVAMYEYVGQQTEKESALSQPTSVLARAVQPSPTSTRPSPTVAARSLPTTPARVNDQAGDFDFYVLALSWSPNYCASNGADDPQQCSLGKKLGLVLHGLWPQYDKGYPSDCSTTRLPENVKARFPALYPSPKSYDHEWEKHGTCSGLTPEQYLSLSKKLKDSVAIPARYRAPEKPIRVTVAQLKQEFTVVNPDLSASSLAVNCTGSGRFLQELFVCFSLEGRLASCSEEIQRVASKSCQNPDLLVQNVR